MLWNFKQYSKETALLDSNGKSIDYEELFEAGERLYKSIDKRCLVFCLCTNQIGSVIGYTSFVNHKIVPVLLAANIDSQLLDNLLEKYKPEYIWAPTKEDNSVRFGDECFSEYDYSLYRTGYMYNHVLHSDLALLLTTSGSTGSPKLVRQTYSNIKANTESIIEYLKITSSERPITTLPMNYTYGLSIINTHLYAGAAILLTEYTIMQKEFWSFFKTNEATSFGGVPYTYEMLNRLRMERMDLPSLKTMTQAGGKLSPDLHRKMAEYAQKSGKQFFVMYGQCEATARMAYLPSEKSLEKAGSMGIAIPGGKLLLIDEDGREITDVGIEGELVYEGPNVTMGYADCIEDLAKGDERNGILKTGDIAKVDEDSFFYIVGRKKRFLKIYGNRVNLDEVDRLIVDNFDIDECASSGVDDHLYIFILNDKYAEDIRSFVVSKTHLNPIAIKTVVVPEIPKNDSGKILYKELERFF